MEANPSELGPEVGCRFVSSWPTEEGATWITSPNHHLMSGKRRVVATGPVVLLVQHVNCKYYIAFAESKLIRA